MNEELSPALAMHTASQLIDLVLAKRSVIKKNIRSMKSNIKKLRIFINNFSLISA